MRFGETLAHLMNQQWRYIDYDALKMSIEDGACPREFLTLLMREIAAVDHCFERLMMEYQTGAGNPTSTHGTTAAALRTYAVLNYLACLKICKKQDKNVRRPKFAHNSIKAGLRKLRARVDANDEMVPFHTSTTAIIERELDRAFFCRALRGSALFEHAEDLQPESAPTEQPRSQCAICLEDMPTEPVVLPCSHSFCWACLTQCTAYGINKCPLCRVEQSLAPVEIEIETLLGNLAQGYFPSTRLPSHTRPTARSAGSAGSHLAAPLASASDLSSDSPPELTILTWNVCAVAFPFRAPLWQLLAGMILNSSWHDVSYDTSLLRSGQAVAPWPHQLISLLTP